MIQVQVPFRTGSWFCCENQIAVFISDSDPDLVMLIAIMIAIEKLSGKTGDQCSDQIRFPIFGSKSGSVFHFEIDP